MLGKKKNKVNSLFCPDKADTKACRKKTNVLMRHCHDQTFLTWIYPKRPENHVLRLSLFHFSPFPDANVFPTADFGYRSGLQRGKISPAMFGQSDQTNVFYRLKSSASTTARPTAVTKFSAVTPQKTGAFALFIRTTAAFPPPAMPD